MDHRLLSVLLRRNWPIPKANCQQEMECFSKGENKVALAFSWVLIVIQSRIVLAGNSEWERFQNNLPPIYLQTTEVLYLRNWRCQASSLCQSQVKREIRISVPHNESFHYLATWSIWREDITFSLPCPWWTWCNKPWLKHIHTEVNFYQKIISVSKQQILVNSVLDQFH